MKVSFWNHTADEQPNESGYYLSYRGWGMGGKADGDCDHGYLYYHKKTNMWYEYEGEVHSMHPRTAIVYYWTDATPDEWVDSDVPLRYRKEKQQAMHPAEQEALTELKEAIKRYETVRALCEKS